MDDTVNRKFTAVWEDNPIIEFDKDDKVADNEISSMNMIQKADSSNQENLYDLSSVGHSSNICITDGLFVIDYENTTTSTKYADFRIYNTGKVQNGKSYTYILEVLSFESSAETQEFCCGETFNWQEINTNEQSCFSNMQTINITGVGTYKVSLSGRTGNYRWLTRDYIPIVANSSISMVFKVSLYENSDTYLGQNLYLSNPDSISFANGVSVNKGVYTARFTSTSNCLYSNLFNSNNIATSLIKAGKSYTFVVDVLKFSSTRGSINLFLGATSGRSCRFDREVSISIFGPGRYTATVLGVDYEEGVTEFFSRTFIAWDEEVGVTYDMTFTISLYETAGYFPEAEREGFTHLGWTKEKGDGETLNVLSSVKSNEDHVLYSAWEANPVTINFDMKFESRRYKRLFVCD